MPPRNSSDAPATSHTFLLRDVPLEIWDKAEARARAQRPPLAMRWLLIGLLEQYANGGQPPIVTEPAPTVTPSTTTNGGGQGVTVEVHDNSF